MQFWVSALMKSKMKSLFTLNMLRQGKKTGLTNNAERFRVAIRRDWKNFPNSFQSSDSIILSIIAESVSWSGWPACGFDTSLDDAECESRDPQCARHWIGCFPWITPFISPLSPWVQILWVSTVYHPPAWFIAYLESFLNWATEVSDLRQYWIWNCCG